VLSQSYETILANLEGVVDLCNTWGLGDLVARGRVADYRRRLIRLVEAMHAIRGGRDPNEAMAVINTQHFEYYVALIESYEIGDLFDFLKNTNPEAVVSKLKKALAGPPMLTEETPTSNEARNLLFELTLASMLWSAGVKPELGESPDLACVVTNKRLLIECKRPFGEAGVRKAVRDAKTTLNRQLRKEAPGTRGVVAISLSKVINAGDKLFAFTGEASGRVGLERATAEIAGRFRPIWGSLAKSKDVVGLLFHVVTGAIDRDGDKYFSARQLDIYPLSKSGSADDQAFIEFGQRLETTRL